MHLPIDYQYVQMLQRQREEEARQRRLIAASRRQSRQAGRVQRRGLALNPNRYPRGAPAPRHAG